MVATGVTPTSATYNALITAFAEDSSSDSSFIGYAKKYFLEMLDKGMKPHPGCYTSVFDAIACLKAIRLYSDLINNTTDKDLRKVFCKWRIRGLKKEALRMFHALVDDGDVDEVKEIVRPILETGVESMVAIYTSIIKAYLNAGKTKGALEAYRGMLAAGMMDKGKRPNVATYTAVIEAFARQEDKAAEEEGKDLVWVMMSKGFVPNAKAMREVLKERPTNWIKLVATVPHARRTNAATYTTVIEGFARQEGRAAEDEGKEFVEVMMGKGLIVPNAKAMREVLKGKPTSVIRRVMNIVLSKLKG
ncbi:pentatricopeptide repeat-containing protein At4g11690-like [Rosa rugosa]|uniref:pentatricopeptide repeat-containing protein At4g11690-like n=1 Tax=Rosa rugosa TaxID=74645 RepID=UPI002B4058B4|nr:pentatricopeptide repeat-containing protein At4g11690-like [Rosa rugosa]